MEDEGAVADTCLKTPTPRWAANEIETLDADAECEQGGFGSLLRGSKGKGKTENTDACRDLSGRRLRHVNAEKKLKEWDVRALPTHHAPPLPPQRNTLQSSPQRTLTLTRHWSRRTRTSGRWS